MADHEEPKSSDRGSEVSRRKRDPKSLSDGDPIRPIDEWNSIVEEFRRECRDEPDPFSPDDQLAFDDLLEQDRHYSDRREPIPRPSGLGGIRQEAHRRAEELRDSVPKSPTHDMTALNPSGNVRRAAAVLSSLEKIESAIIGLQQVIGDEDGLVATYIATLIANSMKIGANAARIVFDEEISRDVSVQAGRQKAGNNRAKYPEEKRKLIAARVEALMQQGHRRIDATTQAAEEANRGKNTNKKKVKNAKGEVDELITIDAKTADNYYREFHDTLSALKKFKLPPSADLADSLFHSMNCALAKQT